MKTNYSLEKGEEIFIGVDLHNKNWHVTVMTYDQQLISANIPPKWDALKKILDSFSKQNIVVVYEAGYFGYSLYDYIVDNGSRCVITPPSLIPSEYGNRVKTDRKDSHKLAFLLSRGLLKGIYVPTKEERYHRQVIRRRKQILRDRQRIQYRIKAELKFYGIEIDNPSGKWSRNYLQQLKSIQLGDGFAQSSYELLIKEYEYLNQLLKEQTKLMKQLSETEKYKEQVRILSSVPGISLLIAMEILLELQDVSRFNRGKQLSAYVGLTPSQYSSSDKIRMGRITKCGKGDLRGSLIEAGWMLIRYDSAMKTKYETLKLRCGGKRAIVAIARTLLLRIRRMLMDHKPYVCGLVS